MELEDRWTLGAGAGFAAGCVFLADPLDFALFFWALAAKPGSANKNKPKASIIKAIFILCLYFSANMICLLSLAIIIKASILSI